MTTKLDPWPWATPQPGIYFNMPFSEYCEIRALNSGGIKNILISETDFWSRSWMNPMCDEIDEDTRAKIEGRAYHKLILEGREAFYTEYAPEFETQDRSVLRTADQIKARLRELKVPGAGGLTRKDQLIAKLRSVDKGAKIYEVLEAQHINLHAGRELIPMRTIRNIELANRMIVCHPDLKTYFAGGYPEVTVIWDDPEFGVRFKVRIDYLKIGPVCDLKTFANILKKEINRAIRHAIAAQKYHIQAWLYLRAADFAKNFVMTDRVYGAEGIDPEWLEEFSQTDAEEFRYVFQQKGIAPVSRGAKFLRSDEEFNGAARICVEDATERFKRAYLTFGEDPWVDLSRPEILHFQDFPNYISDI